MRCDQDLPEDKGGKVADRLGKVAENKSNNVEKAWHYQFGENGEYEVFKVLDAWGMWDDAALFNVIKYVARSRRKGRFLEDLKKARVYLDRRIKMEEQAED